MDTVTKTRPASKPARTLAFVANADEMSPTAGLLTITVGKDSDAYVVTEFSTGMTARGFVLSKVVGGGGYTVSCSRHGAGGDSCDCPANTFGRKCKHTAAIRKLVEAGRL